MEGRPRPPLCFGGTVFALGLVLRSYSDRDSGEEKMAKVKLTMQGGVFSATMIDLQGVSRGTSGNRGGINVFSERSRSRMSRYLRSCTADYRFMLTLTYPSEFECFTRPKNDLARFIRRLRALFDNAAHEVTLTGRAERLEPWSIFWFIEFQERGAPHFHIFTNRFVGFHWVANAWYECVGSGDPQHRKAGTRTEALRVGRHGACSYALKYATKAAQKDLPRHLQTVGRWWGVCGLSSVRAASVSLSREGCNIPIVRAMLNRLRQRLAELEFDGLARHKRNEHASWWRIKPAAQEEIFLRVEELCREAIRGNQEQPVVTLESGEQATRPPRPTAAGTEWREGVYSPRLLVPGSSAQH